MFNSLIALIMRALHAYVSAQVIEVDGEFYPIDATFFY